jgi:hypothetical protein
MEFSQVILGIDIMEITENSVLFSSYKKALVNKVYKILPLYEESNVGLFANIQSLIYELHGILIVIHSLNKNANFLSLIAILESLSDDSLFFDLDHETVKREVFKCLDLVKKMDMEV